MKLTIEFEFANAADMQAVLKGTIKKICSKRLPFEGRRTVEDPWDKTVGTWEITSTRKDACLKQRAEVFALASGDDRAGSSN